MSGAADLEESFARRATGYLAAQREVYAQVIDTLGEEREAQAASESGRLQSLVIAAGALLRPLADQAPDLSALVSRLRKTTCAGPRVESARGLLREVGMLAAEAHRSVELLLDDLRAEQARTLEEINELDRATPTAYLTGAASPALLLDRTG